MPPCPARRRKAGERTVSAETLEQFGPRPSTAADCQPDLGFRLGLHGALRGWQPVFRLDQ